MKRRAMAVVRVRGEKEGKPQLPLYNDGPLLATDQGRLGRAERGPRGHDERWALNTRPTLRRLRAGRWTANCWRSTWGRRAAAACWGASTASGCGWRWYTVSL